MLVELDPYIIRIGSWGIRWYGFLMAVSMAMGLYYFLRHGRRQGFREEHLYNMAFVSLLAGVVGARLVYVITNIGFYLGQPAEIVRVDHGGLSWHGGVGGGMLAGWLYVRRYPPGVDRALARLLDLAVPGLCVGYVLVRIGNIFNGEVLGRAGTLLPWDRHPAQLYGSAIGVALLVLHNVLARRQPPPGYLFWSWALYYSLLRGLVEETFRANPLYVFNYVDDRLGIGFTTMTQLVTPFLVLLAYAMLRRTVSAGGPGERATARPQS